jgi:CheY-like chemotaxis protein
MLESFSFEVTQAASGPEGLAEIERAAKDHPYDMVVMDWEMPDRQSLPRMNTETWSCRGR